MFTFVGGINGLKELRHMSSALQLQSHSKSAAKFSAVLIVRLNFMNWIMIVVEVFSHVKICFEALSTVQKRFAVSKHRSCENPPLAQFQNKG